MSEDLGLQLNISIPTVKEVREQMLIMQDKAPIALQRAINNTIKQVQKDVGKEAKQKYIISQPEVKKTLHIKKATKKELTGIVSSRNNKKPRLYGFKVTPKEVLTGPWRGNQPPAESSEDSDDDSESLPTNEKPEFYMARIKKRVKEKAMTGDATHSKAFVAKMKSGHIGVFQRMLGVYRNNPRPGRKKDEKIAELYSLSIPSMIKSRDVAFAIQSKGQKYLEAQVQKEIRRVMGLK